MAREPVRIANCSGFYGDRCAAAWEMVAGGPIDVLTGDWLAELTMLILARQRAKRPDAGFASTFIDQVRDVLADCVAKGVRIVANAGGVNPSGCAAAVRSVAAELGVEVGVATVVGDDLLPRLDELRASGERLAHLDSGVALADAGIDPVSANAYLGGWGIATALGAGADVVVTGRVTDAALVVGPAAWWHGWQRDDWDALAGAVVAGHVIECGTQATGGNFAFFSEVPGLDHPGFPIAEVAADGSAVITKHPGTGGAVTVETVTAQLLYEIGDVRYPNPDVVARFDTIQLEAVGPDRVRVAGTRGEPAPPTTKVAVNYIGGHRNTVTMVLTGLDIEAKAGLAESAFWAAFPRGRDTFEDAAAELVAGDGFGVLHITVVDRDRDAAGRAFSSVATEMALGSYPGFFTLSPPGDARECGVYWPALVDAHVPQHRVLVDGACIPVAPTVAATRRLPAVAAYHGVDTGWGGTVHAPLGRLIGARSGDKGGHANIGVWARSAEAFDWLAWFLTPDRVHELVPETRPFAVERYDLPNLLALNFVVRGLLGRGVAASTRLDAQAKSLGERLRAAIVAVPDKLLG